MHIQTGDLLSMVIKIVLLFELNLLIEVIEFKDNSDGCRVVNYISGLIEFEVVS